MVSMKHGVARLRGPLMAGSGGDIRGQFVFLRLLVLPGVQTQHVHASSPTCVWLELSRCSQTSLPHVFWSLPSGTRGLLAISQEVSAGCRGAVGGLCAPGVAPCLVAAL